MGTTNLLAEVCHIINAEEFFPTPCDEENLALIKRKVPEIRLKDLTDTLRNVFHTLFSYFSIENEDDIRAFEDGYLAVLHLFLIPDLENLDDTISFLIRGLVLQMVE